MSEFLNIIWENETTQKIWEPRIRSIRRAWKKIEWYSVYKSVRSCCLIPLSQEELIEYAFQFLNLGLSYYPIKTQKLQSDKYSNKFETPNPTDKLGYRVVVGSRENVLRFIEAWNLNDHFQIGKMLGYPSCCSSFFVETWIDKNIIDTTWHTALKTKNKITNQDTIQISALPQNNILGRWLGIRAVPHLPCSFDCNETLNLADKLIEVGNGLGFNDELKWLKEILAWHYEWTSQDGIAEIKTDDFLITTNTDNTMNRLTVSINGLPNLQ
jgi:hypothetical protein